MTDGDLLCFSHLRWGFVYQRPNHLVARFARQRRVFFFEEPLFDASYDTPTMATTAVEDRLYVCTPHLPSDIDSAMVPRVIRRLIDEFLAARRVDPEIQWFYTPMALPFARHIDARVVVYDCMDELSAFAGAPSGLADLETELFERAHLVFTGGHSLYQVKKARHGNIHPFPSSVEAAHFGRARKSIADPPDQLPIGGPRLGYAGVIDERMDLDLLTKIADARPEWHIVMLGPVVKIDPQSLPRRPNLHWLGMKNYRELPDYLGGWDVALMPFALNESTRYISPTKTLEYLAAGLPVVSTPIADVVFPYGDQGLVSIGSTPVQFVEAIERALTHDSEERRRAADEYVRRTSWDNTWREMAGLIDAVVKRGQVRTAARVRKDGAQCSIT